MFVVVYSPWERQKVERFRRAGLKVVVVDNLKKGISGQEVRSLLASNGNWERLVPPIVARFLQRKPEDEG
jgi:nicotinic acid mononucleotide adenylyltransferase